MNRDLPLLATPRQMTTLERMDALRTDIDVDLEDELFEEVTARARTLGTTPDVLFDMGIQRALDAAGEPNAPTRAPTCSVCGEALYEWRGRLRCGCRLIET